MKTSLIIRLVASREIRDRIRNRAFLISTVAMLLIVAGLIIVPSIFEDSGPASYELGVIGGAEPLFSDSATAAADAQDAELALRDIDDRAAGETAVEEGEVDAVLVDPDTVLVADDLPDQLRTIIEQARQQTAVLSGLADAGVDLDEAGSLLSGRAPVDVLTPSGTEDEADNNQGIAFMATILLFVIIQINGSTLLTGTIEEKSSRVVEVLLGSVRPWQLLAGKLSGIMTLAIGQLVLFITVVLGANAVVGTFDVPPAAATGLAVAILMFLLGFAFYASMYAVAGSMASSLEDAQSTAGPLGFLTLGAYVGTLLGVVPNPDSAFAQVLTMLPPTAPFATPARVAVGSISVVEIALSAIITGVAAVLAIRLAGRLYSAAILAGGKLTWREVWRAEPVS